MPDWHLYVVRTRAGHLYTGVATDVARRVREHESDARRGARALRGRGPLEIVYQRKLGDQSLALQAEQRMKRLPKEEKEAIVTASPSRRVLLRRLLPEDTE